MVGTDCPRFGLNFVSIIETVKEVNNLSNKKASKASDMPVKTIKENKDLIGYFIYNA